MKEREERIKKVKEDQEAERAKKADELKQQVWYFLRDGYQLYSAYKAYSKRTPVGLKTIILLLTGISSS